jgi:serine/threonine protein kinase
MTDTPTLDDRYRLIERLGKGGVSVVWRGHDEVLGRPVAIKVMNLGAESPSPDRIRAEARALARLSHPHIAAVYDYGVSTAESGEHMPYLVMELLSGQTLADQLKAEGPLPVPVALLISAQVASALAAAHDRAVVHRNVKPANVMLTPAGVKVLGFGLASGAELARDAEVFGPPACLAPERLSGSQAGPASDVFGLGLLLYAGLAGRLPWQDETIAEMLATHEYAEPSRLSRLFDAPRAVRSLLDRCLAKEPERRPTASEVAAGLAEAVARGWHGSQWVASAMVGSGLELPAGTPAWGTDGAAIDRRGAAAMAAVVVVALALVGGVVGMTTEPLPPLRQNPDVVAQEPASPSRSFPTLPSDDGDGVYTPPDGGPGAPETVELAPVAEPENAGDEGNSEPESAPEPESESTEPEPADPEPPAEPPAPEPETVEVPPPDPSPTTLATDAGTLVVECVGNTASLVSSDLLPGFSVVEPGPGAEVRVSALLLSVVVTCRGGVPSTAVELL